MKQLEDFYSDSQTKSKTRYSIVEAAVSLFSENSIESLKMAVIAETCEITVRNLYRYYPTKESIAVDAAFHIFSKLSVSDAITLELEKSGKEQLKQLALMIAGYGKNFDSQLTFIKFVMHFDLFLTTLNSENESLKKYISDYVPNINNSGKRMINEALLTGIKDNSINLKEEETDFYSEYIIQSLFSITMRVAVKESENPDINKDLIAKQIDVIMKYISK